MDEAADRLRWLGHSTVFVALGGTRLLTDPLLRRRLFHLWRPSPVEPEDLESLDGVLVSHVHYDHLDLPSLRRLPRTTHVVAPLGAGRLLRRKGFASVTELTAGEQVELGGLAVHAVHADHTSSRLGTKTEPLGYVIAGRKRIYFPGDTDIFPGMEELSPVDVALMPIWGWGPSLGPGHLDPQRAAEALKLIRPRGRRADPLGHVLPALVEARAEARVPRGTGHCVCPCRRGCSARGGDPGAPGRRDTSAVKE